MIMTSNQFPRQRYSSLRIESLVGGSIPPAPLKKKKKNFSSARPWRSRMNLFHTGGLKFFCTAMEKPEGDIVLLTESMKAMNARSDPTEEERKGGAGRIGKLLLSMNDDQLALVSYVPLDNCDKCKADEWLKHVVTMIADGPKNVEKYATFEKCGDVSTDNYYRCVIKADKENNVFPIKMRDPAVTEAYAYLKKRDLFPDGEQSFTFLLFHGLLS